MQTFQAVEQSRLPALPGVRVIALGEPNHGSAEVFALRVQLVLDAVSHGATVVALEAPTDTVTALDQVVQGEVPWDDDLLRGIASWPWRVVEAKLLVQVLRQANSVGGPGVRLVGVDPQVPVLAATALVRWLRSRGPVSDRDERVCRVLATLRAGARLRWGVRERAGELIADASAAGGLDLKQAGALHDALRLTASRRRDVSRATSTRDEVMAARVLAHLPEDGRLVLLAHNGHISRTGYAGGSMRSTGQCLTAVLGEGYWAAGTVVGGGSFRARRRLLGVPLRGEVVAIPDSSPDSSVEARLGELASGSVAGRVDLMDAVPERLAGELSTRSAGWVVDALTWPLTFEMVDLETAYDSVFWVAQVHPTTELPGGFLEPDLGSQ